MRQTASEVQAGRPARGSGAPSARRGDSHAPDYTAAMSAPAASSATASALALPSRPRGALVLLPAHNEAENIRPSSTGALTLPSLADAFRSSLSTTAARTAPPASSSIASEHPGRVSSITPPTAATALPFGGFAAASYPLIAFTDGDRQFRVADLAAAGAGGALTCLTPWSALGCAAPTIRGLRTRRRFCLRLFFGLQVSDVDCACKLFRRPALRASGGVEAAPSCRPSRHQGRGRSRCSRSASRTILGRLTRPRAPT